MALHRVVSQDLVTPRSAHQRIFLFPELCPTPPPPGGRKQQVTYHCLVASPGVYSPRPLKIWRKDTKPQIPASLFSTHPSLSVNSHTPSSLSVNSHTPSSLSVNSHTPPNLSVDSHTPLGLSHTSVQVVKDVQHDSNQRPSMQSHSRDECLLVGYMGLDYEDNNNNNNNSIHILSRHFPCASFCLSAGSPTHLPAATVLVPTTSSNQECEIPRCPLRAPDDRLSRTLTEGFLLSSCSHPRCYILPSLAFVCATFSPAWTYLLISPGATFSHSLAFVCATFSPAWTYLLISPGTQN